MKTLSQFWEPSSLGQLCNCKKNLLDIKTIENFILHSINFACLFVRIRTSVYTIILFFCSYIKMGLSLVLQNTTNR